MEEEEESSSYLKAKEEWDQIQPLSILNILNEEEESRQQEEEEIIEEEDEDDVMISMEQIEDYIERKINLKEEIHAKEKKSFLRRIFSLFFSSKGNKRNQQKDLIFALALKPFNNQDSIHVKMLFTLYKSLTLNQRNQQPIRMKYISRYGNHWEEIGFQGMDPSTDLRGLGFLGLYQLLFLVLRNELISKEIYNLSLCSKQSFPFACMSLNVTSIALDCLREGNLDRLIDIRNSSRTVLELFNQCYLHIFHSLYVKWKINSLDITKAGITLKELREEFKKKKKNFNLENILEFEYSTKKKEEEEIKFTDLLSLKRKPETEEDDEEYYDQIDGNILLLMKRKTKHGNLI